MMGGVEAPAARFDLHVHSRHSPDGRGSVRDIALEAKRKGLDGFVLTDHNAFPPSARLLEAEGTGVLVFAGTEVSTQEGHCLAIGIRKAVTPRRALVDTLEEIRGAGGIGVPSHPYRWVHGVGERALDVARNGLVAVEVYNASDGDSGKNRRAQAYAERYSLGGTGGSDTHRIVEVGNSSTLFPERVEGLDDLLAQLERRVTGGAGTPTPWSVWARQKAKTTGLWLRRGFRSV